MDQLEDDIKDLNNEIWDIKDMLDTLLETVKALKIKVEELETQIESQRGPLYGQGGF